MTDREKIIKIIEKNGVYNGRSLSFDYYVIQPDDLADALIEAGIGDVSEWKRRAEVAEKDLERHKRALCCACKASAAVLTKELVKARVNCFLRKAEREIEEERK